MERYFVPQNATANEAPYKWSITTNCFHYKIQWNGKVTHTTENKMKGNFCSWFIGGFLIEYNILSWKRPRKLNFGNIYLKKKSLFAFLSCLYLCYYMNFWKCTAFLIDINEFGVLCDFCPCWFFFLLFFLLSLSLFTYYFFGLCLFVNVMEKYLYPQR